MEQGLTEGAQIEPTHPRVGIVLAVAKRVIEVEAVDEAQRWLTIGPQNEETPEVATPGGPRDVPVGKTLHSMGCGTIPVKESAANVNLPRRLARGSLPWGSVTARSW